jgi:hypothetical protein
MLKPGEEEKHEKHEKHWENSFRFSYGEYFLSPNTLH